MLKKHSIFFTFIFAASLLFMAGCFGGSDKKKTQANTTTTTAYSNTNVPGNFQVTIPNSLKSTAKKRSLAKIMTERAKITTDRTKAGRTAGGSSQGYQELKLMVEMLDMFASDLKIQFMMVDAMYANMEAYLASHGGNSVPAGAISITITQEMVNKLVELYLTDLAGLVTEDELKQALAGLVGMTMPCPAMTFVKDPNDTDNDGFNFTLTYTDFDTSSTDPGTSENTGTGTTTIKWNTAKTLVSVTYAYDYVDTVDASLNFSGSSKFIYDDTTKKMTYKGSDKFGGTDNSYSITMEQTGANNYVKIDANFTMKDPTFGTMTFDIAGVADDNGGYILETMKMDDGVSAVQTFMYKESFDASGNVTGQSLSTDNGTNWTNVMGDPTTSTYSDDSTTITASVTVAVTGLNGPEAYGFVIVPDGTAAYDAANPDLFYSAMIGSGYFDGTTPSYVDYWGTAAQITGADVYMEMYDAVTYEFTTYKILPDAVVSPGVKK